MLYLIMRRKGRIHGFITAWRLAVERLALGKSIGYGRKIYGVLIRDVIENSIKLVKTSSPYSSIPVVSSSRYVDLYRYVKNWVSVSKLVHEHSLSSTLSTPSLLLAVAQGYVIVVRTNRLGIARTPLGDYLVSKNLLDLRDATDLALTYLIPALYIPSRTQIMYLLMKSVNSTDPEVLAKALRSILFTGGLIDVEKLALATYLELDETGFFEKYNVKKRFYTPTHFAYLFAQLVDKVIDLDTFKKTYVYVTGRKGFTTASAFKKFFENTIVDKDVLDELEAKPRGKTIRRIIESLAENYEEIRREMIKLSRF